MKFYGGALGYWEIEEMPLLRLEELARQADAINKEIQKGAKKNGL